MGLKVKCIYSDFFIFLLKVSESFVGFKNMGRSRRMNLTDVNYKPLPFIKGGFKVFVLELIVICEVNRSLIESIFVFLYNF